MTTYTQENRKFLKGLTYATLLNGYKKYYDFDYHTRKLIDKLDNSIMGQRILKSFIIENFSNEQDFTLSELDEIFFMYPIESEA